MLLLDASGDQVYCCISFVWSNAGLDTSDDVGAVHEAAGQLVLSRLIRQPQIVVSERELKSRGQDSDDLVTLAVDRDAATDDVWIAAEASLPQAVSQDRDSWSTLLVFTGLECSAEERLDAEHVEEVCRHSRRTDVFRLAASTHQRAAAGVRRERFEDVVLKVVLVIGI